MDQIEDGAAIVPLLRPHSAALEGNFVAVRTICRLLHPFTTLVLSNEGVRASETCHASWTVLFRYRSVCSPQAIARASRSSLRSRVVPSTTQLRDSVHETSGNKSRTGSPGCFTTWRDRCHPPKRESSRRMPTHSTCSTALTPLWPVDRASRAPSVAWTVR
ncbi:hypothetical protein H310_06890 [Aphanomyces invadans]|uniref:Uncharacterized protein n=1 Tax=Aphanomyces invadans TaxID=157072 RepID=A0A024U500_9STRA|nr:hypothetical protein H310_06890 [Aphanomyces invadans]ETW01329.1 hypothetical protein H310_06890 [Aphanomyces invadans]|eukprot:XP_008870327.1 hypothetical protein H310_06890 [Aphanomyces invadans]